jgi:hypothetical protein
VGEQALGHRTRAKALMAGKPEGLWRALLHECFATLSGWCTIIAIAVLTVVAPQPAKVIPALIGGGYLAQKVAVRRRTQSGVLEAPPRSAAGGASMAPAPTVREHPSAAQRSAVRNLMKGSHLHLPGGRTVRDVASVVEDDEAVLVFHKLESARINGWLIAQSTSRLFPLVLLTDRRIIVYCRAQTTVPYALDLGLIASVNPNLHHSYGLNGGHVPTWSGENTCTMGLHDGSEWSIQFFQSDERAQLLVSTLLGRVPGARS